jgi:hypothetical protein
LPTCYLRFNCLLLLFFRVQITEWRERNTQDTQINSFKQQEQKCVHQALSHTPTPTKSFSLVIYDVHSIVCNWMTTLELLKISRKFVPMLFCSSHSHIRSMPDLFLHHTNTHTNSHTHTHTHKHIQIQTDTHTHTQTHWSTLVHTHTHTGYAEKTRKKLLDQFNKFILQAFHSNRIYI